ncbi:protein containing Replication initiator A [gut metagenome]|uniref:Protein containing Replication initiator A n=1 Tax=gut metagenome TaxID=749906 RepID=J9GPD8_9ZZZZ
MEFEWFKQDGPQLDYLQMPKFIWEMEGLSPTAKNVYMLIFNRIRQSSKKEQFTTPDGTAFCYFTDDELAKSLGLKKRATINAVNELKNKNLLSRERTKRRRWTFGHLFSCPIRQCRKLHNTN